MLEVQRVSRIDLAEFKARFELPEHPVVIQGGCAHYRAVQCWTPAYLKERLGQEEIQYKLSTTHQHPNFHAKTLAEVFARGSSTLAKFLDDVTSGEPSERSRRYFTGDERFLLKRRDGKDTRDAALSPLLDDVEVPALLPPDRLYTVWGWLSGRGVRTWLHYETNGCHNFNAQLAGTKSCVLYPPEELPKMRMLGPGSGNPAYNCSEIDVEDPAEQAGLSQAHGLTATLQAGDLLFIPAWWFHTFLHHGEFNANINFWWQPERPSLNQVAVRQRFLDALLATGWNEKSASPADVELLARVEHAIVNRS
jgi:lysine-specific demethylase 8